MDTKTIRLPRPGVNGSRPRAGLARAAPATAGLRAAWLLSAMVAVLMVVAPAAGLWIHGRYIP